MLCRIRIVLLNVVLIPAVAAAATPEELKRVERLQPAAQDRGKAALHTLDRHVHTDNVRLNKLVEHVYSKCVLGKLLDPAPPSLPYRWFNPGGTLYVGQWLWDTMFVSSAYAPIGDDAGLRDVFENYWYTIDKNPLGQQGSLREGMVPNYLSPWPPLGYSQIPLLAWGCRLVERQTNDRALIERALSYLERFDKWYSTERDVDGDALIEYGAYEPVGGANLQLTARYESFDLQPTTADMKLTKHPQRDSGGQWYGDREGIEQTCFLIMSEEAMVQIAETLGHRVQADKYRRQVERRIRAIQEKMWDPRNRFFYSLERDSDRQLPIRGIGGFFTMTCGAATREQAAALVEQLQDPKQWWSRYPVPTVARDDAKSSPTGYWSGDMWPATTYLVMIGLCRYGYDDLARQLGERLVDLVEQSGINERYDPTTGKGLGIPDLGMSCCLWDAVMMSTYGVQIDFRTVRVPPHMKGRHLLLGRLEVKYPDENVVETKSTFDREMRIVFPIHTGGSIELTRRGRAVEHVTHPDADSITFLAVKDEWYRIELRSRHQAHVDINGEGAFRER